MFAYPHHFLSVPLQLRACRAVAAVGLGRGEERDVDTGGLGNTAPVTSGEGFVPLEHSVGQRRKLPAQELVQQLTLFVVARWRVKMRERGSNCPS